jgi:hypothetical protein
VKPRILALSAGAALATATAAIAAQAAISGPQTTAPPPVIDIRVTITDSAVKMSPKIGYRGDYARFSVVNSGKKPHTLSFGHQKRGAGVQTGFTAALKPSQQKILLLFLDYRGKVPYAGTLAADRAKPGMKGTFTIK